MSRQVAGVISNNTPSNLPSAPLMSYYISGVEYDQRRTQSPSFVDKVQVRQRAYNYTTGEYEPAQGEAFTVERLMPVPYTLRVNVDIWTTNTQQKHEIIEQIGPLFNPGLEIQSTDNFLDWTSLSVVYQDGLSYTSRSIPQGNSSPIDILTWKFYMPIWLSTPARIRKMGVIEKVIASIHKGHNLWDVRDEDLLLGTRQKITPYGYKILLLNNTLQLLPEDTPFDPRNESLELPEGPDSDIYWSSFLNMYGVIRPGISQIWLQNPYMELDIVGTIVPDPLDDRLLIFNIDADTLPQNTIAPVNGVVNPLVSGPNAGLPGPVPGRRYLLVEAIGNGTDLTTAWGDLVANANDIVEYNGITLKWELSFDSSASTNVQYVLNLNTNVQYRYVDGAWMKSVEGWYAAGDFSIVI